jgi:murein L,D-transpeptidase YafK
MLKHILLETYKPEEKLINFISNIPNTKIRTSNGKSELIEKTNIKLISPVIIKIQNDNTKLEIWSYQNEEILNKSYYIPSTKESI